MFYYLTGKITIMEENLAVVDCNGVGYACHATAYTLSKLRLGEEARLYTTCNIREDAFDIFGFSSREELRCFELLLGVSGVGPKAALAILSAASPDCFTLAVMTGDEKAMTMAQGVGKKLAQRIILELKDKLGGTVDLTEGGGFVPAAKSGNAAIATAALAELGYSQSEISMALKGADAENLSAQELIRYGLRAMVTR